MFVHATLGARRGVISDWFGVCDLNEHQGPSYFCLNSILQKGSGRVGFIGAF